MSLFIIRFKASVQQYAEIRHKLIKQILGFLEDYVCVVEWIADKHGPEFSYDK